MPSDLETIASIIGAPADSVLMIGDTCHDKEVADLLNVAVILCTHGHFPVERLVHCGTHLIASLTELGTILSSI